jgi:hypothetical protein
MVAPCASSLERAGLDSADNQQDHCDYQRGNENKLHYASHLFLLIFTEVHETPEILDSRLSGNDRMIEQWVCQRKLEQRNKIEGVFQGNFSELERHFTPGLARR